MHVILSGVSNRLSTLRGAILRRVFELLYGPFVLFHEPLGRTILGPAWQGRRQLVADRLASAWTVVDVGSGAGHFVEEASRRGHHAVGVEPSPDMRRLARRRGVQSLEGRAQEIPLATSFADALVVTYPGNWILDRPVWDEFARILKPGGRVIILLGGTAERGPGSVIRRLIHRLAYGLNDDPGANPALEQLGHPEIPGGSHVEADRWGRSILWIGRRS